MQASLTPKTQLTFKALTISLSAKTTLNSHVEHRAKELEPLRLLNSTIVVGIKLCEELVDLSLSLLRVSGHR